MSPIQFNQYIGKVETLSEGQLEHLISVAKSRQNRVRQAFAVDVARGNSACAHCGSVATVRNGMSRGAQRYLCKDCGRSFNAATNTPLSGLRNKNRSLEIADCLARNLTIKQMAAEMGIARSTAFRLRHRFLSEAVNHQPAGLAGLVEMDETFFRESQKGSRKLESIVEPGKARPPRHHGGKPKKDMTEATPRPDPKRSELVPVLVARLRGQPHIGDRVLPAMNKTQVKNAISDWLGAEALLCTDGSGTLRQAAAELKVPAKHVAVSYEGRVKEGVYHVQSVNRYHQALKLWINHDRRGVATKYLPNYLAWMRMREWFKDDLRPERFIESALGRKIINT